MRWGINSIDILSRNNYYRIGIVTTLFFFLLALVGCLLITRDKYDPTSYLNATDLKAESLHLIHKATDPPGPHEAEIDRLRLNLRKAYEYELGKEEADVTFVQKWKLLIDPSGGLIGAFIDEWEKKNTGLSSDEIDVASKMVGEAFDEIIKIQSYKVKE